MIVLDTNVISELMKPQGSLAVCSWVDSQPTERLHTTTVTQAEILYGIEILPSGARRKLLHDVALAMFREDFAGKILPFDSAAAEYFAEIAAHRRRSGSPISQFDAQIAAICRAHQAVLATRNVADFEDCGVVIVNPWEPGVRD